MLGAILFAVLSRWVRLAAVVLLVLLGARSARAFPSSRLVYVRGPGAESCPDQAAVREAVKKRLGYDPFFPSSDKTIIARVLREAATLRGEVELVDEHGSQVGRREFSAPSAECEQLVRAMALSISIAIDPQSAETYRQGPEVVSEAEPAENQRRSQPDAAPEPAPPAAGLGAGRPAREAKPALARVPWLWSAGLGPTLQFGSLPGPALGAIAFAALRRSAWSLALEAELDFPVTTQEQGVELRSASYALKLVPCGHWQWALACQLTALRWLDATGSASGLGGNALSLALGARLGAELPLSRSFSALAYGDLLLTAVTVSLRSQDQTLWETPLLSGGLAIAAVVHFP